MKTTHKCPVTGCVEQQPQHLLMCARHWRMVPQTIQAKVWETWKSGSVREYLKARSDAIKAVNDLVIQ